MVGLSSTIGFGGRGAAPRSKGYELPWDDRWAEQAFEILQLKDATERLFGRQ